MKKIMSMLLVLSMLLMGAAMAVRGISDALMLIIGTDECTYYTKHFSIHADNFGGLNGRCVSVALDGHDVTFGCAKKVEDAFDEMMAEYHPQAVFLVTTCVVEIIGDDIDALAGSSLDAQAANVARGLHLLHNTLAGAGVHRGVRGQANGGYDGERQYRDDDGEQESDGGFHRPASAPHRVPPASAL